MYQTRLVSGSSTRIRRVLFCFILKGYLNDNHPVYGNRREWWIKKLNDRK